MNKQPPKWNLREWVKMWRILGRLPMPTRNAKQIQRLYWALYIRRNPPKPSGCLKAGSLVLHYTSQDHLRRLFHEIFLEQCYAVMTSAVNPRIVDCGANIGMSLLYFKMCWPGARITAFEPDGKALACCRANITDNKLAGIDLHEAAVAATEGKIDFYAEDHNPGSLTATTVLPRSEYSKSLAVKAVRLSQYINEEVDILKIDIEGGEFEVLDELSSSGKLPLIKQMAIEYHHHLRKDSESLSAFLRILESSGFGYQIQTRYLRRPFSGPRFQDVLIYTFRK